MIRLHNLDYLRGFAALGIMIYHFSRWTFGEFPAETFIGRVGIYGVSVFYVLSGLTLFFVYQEKMNFNLTDIGSFFRKRFFRIFPLLWLATILAVILSKKVPDFLDLFLNLSGLFGFIKWEAYFSTGAWSIGNELVFYVFFPFFIYFSKALKPLLWVLTAIIFGLYIYFAFYRLTPESGLTDQWVDYINPLNQVFLFLGGYLIGFLLTNAKINPVISVGLIITGLLIFILFPANGDAIHLVTGWNRIVFTFCCFLVCAGFYKLSLELPGVLHKSLTYLGEASYSVYMLHPIVYAVTGVGLGFVAKKLFAVSEWVIFPVAIIGTLIISYFVYYYFEKYFMKFGKRKSNS